MCRPRVRGEKKKLSKTIKTLWKQCRLATFIYTLKHTELTVIHFTSRAFGTEMCGKVLIKSMSVQPLVKTPSPGFRLLSPSLLFSCQVDSATHFKCLLCQMETAQTQAHFVVGGRWGGAPVGYNCFFFFQVNEVSVAMFTEGVIIHMWDMGDFTCACLFGAGEKDENDEEGREKI